MKRIITIDFKKKTKIDKFDILQRFEDEERISIIDFLYSTKEDYKDAREVDVLCTYWAMLPWFGHPNFTISELEWFYDNVICPKQTELKNYFEG
jgi:hypothetical protein